jgi:hypothetical protein
METNFFVPADLINKYTNESTFVIEKQFGERAFLFAEYVGEFRLSVAAVLFSTRVVATALRTPNKSISISALASTATPPLTFLASAIHANFPWFIRL